MVGSFINKNILNILLALTSVAEPSHFSSAPALDIFSSSPAPPIKARLRPAPTGSGYKIDIDTKHLKNLNFDKYRYKLQ